MGTGASGIGIDASASGGDVTISAAAVTGSASGIKAATTGAGYVSISASGEVSSAGTGGIGIDASASNGDVTISAAAVTGTDRAIKAAATGAGNVSISASDAVTGTGTDGVGIGARASGGNVIISAATVTGTDTGIEVEAAGDGNVSISASGAVTGTSADGIMVGRIGAGATTIAVTAAVTGGIGANVAAIRTNVSVGRDVTISLGSGASVGAGGRNAIVGDTGNTSVTVNTGATISGKINLGGGADTLTFASGTFSDITELDGGDGSADTLTFSGVSGSVTGLAGWETVTIDGGSEIRLASGSVTIEGNLNVRADAIFEIGNDADSDDDLTISGDFAGGGTITFDANFTETTPASDSLTITQDVTGVTVIDVNQFGSGSATGLDRPGEIDLITVQGTVDAAAFTFEKITFQNATYRLRTKTENSQTVFYLFRSGINDCLETVDGSGIFTCGGTGLISDPQKLGASGSTDLRVTLDSETPVTVAYEDAFSLTQPGAADIVFVQLIEGQDIAGKDSGILAHNTSGGSISIDVNGSVTGEAGDGIRASSDTSGTGIAIIAASVSGAKSGIVAIGSGAGDVSVSANGAVAGTADYGIHARTGLSGTGLAVSAGTVTGGKTGIRALGSGTGGVSVIATGAVVGTVDYGIHARTGLSGTGLTVSAGTVTGGKTGIRALGSGTGGVSVIATGAVVGTVDYGIHARTGLSGTGLTVSAGTVTGGKTGIRALGSGTGGVSVIATGAVVGTVDYGIHARTGLSGTGLTVSAGTVTGGKTGIRALGSGTGGVSVTATGAVVGTVDYGIYAMTAPTGTDLTVSAGAVTGGKTGIKAVGSGSGAVSVSATGEVMGSGTIGVIVSGGTGTGDMTVSVATVSGEDGIDARQTGTGDLTVRARSVMAKRGGVKAVGSGAGNVTVNVDESVHVEGDEAWGVDALASGDGDLSVTLGSVTAGNFAVKAISSGAGSVSVSASYARVRRSSGNNNNEIVAIQASGGSTSTGVAVAVGTAFSSEVGIDALHEGTGDLSVTATGSVTGTRTVGIRAIGSNSADVRVHAEKLVQSDQDGIDAQVSGSGDLTINVASVMGENHGIKAENTGTGGVSIDASGAVRAVSKDTQSSTFSEVGIWARVSGAGALRIAAASVTGDNYGIDAKSDGEGAVSVVSTGLVEGNKKAGIKAIGGTATASVAVTAATVTSSEGAGIDARQRGAGALSVTATETVSGNTWGIMAVGSGDGAVSVSAAGTVTGASEHGIEAMGMKAVSVAAAAVSGMKTGILAKSEGSGSVSVEASGAVTGEAEHGISAISESTGISVAVATVTGKESGIHAENKGSGLVSVRASGTVTGESEHGIEARSMDGGVTVETAAISGAKSGILADNKGAGSVRVVASGSVTTTSSISGMHGVHAMNSASGSAISIETRAAVTARKNAIYADNSGGDVRVTSAAAVDGGDYGVRVKAVSGIDLSLDGVIGKSKSAVYATNSESGDVIIALRGAVEGSGSGNHGIHAINEGSQSGAMFIRSESPATVSGMQSGVVADNRGIGLLTIDLKAAVTGEEGYGIRAVNSGEGITIRAGSASGATHGIFAEGVAGQLWIDATGSVAGTGSDADGIRAINRGSALTRIVVSGSVSGEKSGIHAENSYSYASGMAVEVARSGSVSGKVDGIRLTNRQEEGAITLTVTGRVEGGSGFGIHAQAGDAPVMVDVAGTVTGTSDSGGGAVRIENVAGRNLAEVAVRSGGLIDAGSGIAIWNGDGNAVVRMDGGRIAGRIALGSGDDQFIWNGGSMSGVTELDGGERAGNDRIRILSDMTAAQTEGLLKIPGVRNWDEISIEGNATASFLGADNADITLSALRVKENATVSFVNSSTDDRITMRGDLIGERGTLAMDVSFSEREADRLTLDGGTAQGTTMISIVNPSGDLPSVDEGIVLVEVVGAQNVSKSAFELSAASARRGLFANTLTRETRNGSTVFSIQTSDRLGEFGSILQVTPALVRGAFKNLPMRPYGDSGNRAPWLRAGGERLNIGASEMREEASSDVFRLEGGVDLMQVEGAGGSWTFGVSAQHTTISGRTTVDGGNGSVDTQAFGIGATASWRGESNFFFDAAGQVNRSKSDISTDGSGVLMRDTRMDARAVGAAMGRRISAGSGIYLMPKVEFAYGQVSGGEFAAKGGIDGDFGSSNFFTAGIGSRIEFPTRSGSAYLSGSIVEEFSGKSNVSAGGFDIAVEEDPMEVRLGFGGYREVGEGARLMLEGTHVFSVGGDSGKRVSGGLSGGIRWEW